MAELNFKRSDAPEAEGFEVIPAGKYAAQVIQSDMKETKAGTGMYLELRIQLLDEPYTGRLVFERLNLVNPNETAVNIAKRKLAELCEALGFDEDYEVEDSEELHGIEFIVELSVEPPKGDWGESNKVKKFIKDI